MKRRTFFAAAASFTVSAAVLSFPQIAHGAPRASASGAKSPKVLVAYFSWYDSVDPKRITKKDISEEAAHSLDMDSGISQADAVSAASLNAPGLVTRVARWIGAEAAAPVMPIATTELYPTDFNTCYDRAVDEKVKRYRPKLTAETRKTIEAAREADVVFLCFPNWAYDLPTAVCAFAESGALAGKTVIPVCLHGTGGLARAVVRLRECAKGAKFRPTLSLYRITAQFEEKKIRDWAKDALAKAQVV